MQTIEQLMSKVLDLIEEARHRGEKPDLVFLTADDEHTLMVHAWLRAKDGDKPDALHKAPPVALQSPSRGSCKERGKSGVPEGRSGGDP